MASLTDRSALTFAMPGIANLQIGLSRLRTDIADWRPFWEAKFAPFFYRQNLENFVLEGAATGGRWAPLSTAYAQWKARHFPNAGILVRSGALKASLLSQAAPGAIFRSMPQALEVGTSTPYGVFHQSGTRRMPARPPLRVDEPFMVVVAKQLQRYIQETWKARQAETQAFGLELRDTGSFGL